MIAAALLIAALAQTPSAKDDVWSEVRAQLGTLRKGADPAEVLRELRRRAVVTREDPLEARRLARRFVRDDAALQRAVICAIAGPSADEVANEEVLDLAGSERAVLRETAVWMLALRHVETEEAQILFEGALADPDPAVRRTAVWALGSLARDPWAVVMDVIPGSDCAASGGAIGIGGGSMDPGERAWTLLENSGRPLGLRSPRLLERFWRSAVEWIDAPGFLPEVPDPAAIPPRLAATAPAIVGLLGDQDDGTVQLALWALEEAAPLAASELPRLMDWVRSPDDPRRQSAVQIVVRMGSPAKGAADQIRELSGHEDGWMRWVSIAALANAGLAPSDEALLAELSQHHPASGIAMELLATREPPPPAALEPLADHFLSGGYAAAGALTRYGQRAVQFLLRGLDHEWSDVRAVASIALGRIGPAAGAARSRLAELAEGSDRNLAKVAREALERIGGG